MATSQQKTKVMKPSMNEKTQLLSSSHSRHDRLSYYSIILLMINRSLNIVFYKALPTFSWYFAEYFEMDYTLFAVTVLNIGALINIPIVPYYKKFKIRFVIFFFELMLSLSLLLILSCHTVICLFISRIILTFSVTAIRTQVNNCVAAFTHGKRRKNAIGIIEISFGFNGIGFIIIGYILKQYGYKIFFISSIILIIFMSICMILIIPSSDNISKKKNKKNKKIAIKQIKEALTHKRLQLIFISILLNKIARNAFYYTFSKWLSINYNLNPQQTGYMTLCIGIGCLFGTMIIPIIVKKLNINTYLICFLSAFLQIISMIIEPIYHIIHNNNNKQQQQQQHISIYVVCLIIFLFFCGCQVWYNNIMDIMIGVTPTPKLLPAVHIILLISGLFGGYIGTIGSTVWYTWGNHIAISIICAIINIGISFILFILWIIANRKKQQQQQQQVINDDDHNDADCNDDEDVIPQVVSDTSYGLFRIVGGKKKTPKNQNNLKYIDEEQVLIRKDVQ